MAADEKHKGGAKPLAGVNWEDIEAACIAGLSYLEAEKRYGVKANTIRQRAQRKKWPTPTAIASRAKELSRETGQNPAVIMADWQSRGEKWRENVFQIATESLKTVKKLKVNGAKDFELIDKVGRRAAGLDVADTKVQTLIHINESIDTFENEPIEATLLPENQDTQNPDVTLQGDRAADAENCSATCNPAPV